MINRKYIILSVFIVCIMFSVSSVVCASSMDNSTGSHGTDSISTGNNDNLNVNTDTYSVKYNDKRSSADHNSKNLKSSPTSTRIVTSDVNCSYGKKENIPVEITPAPSDGVVSLYVDDNLLDARNLSMDDSSFEYDGVSYGPGVYDMYVDYSGSNTYSNCGDNSHKLSVYDDSILSSDKLNVSLDRYTRNSTGICFNAEAGSVYADYNPVSLSDGSIDFYINNNLVTSTSYVEDGTVINITSPMVDNLDVGCYNWTAVYTNTNTYLRSSSLSGTLTVYESRPVMLSAGNVYECDVGSTVSIPVSFNSSVDDGILSLSYGGSVDYEACVNSSNMILYFDTAGYLPGEYNMVINYNNSLRYMNTSTSTTVRVYQPTNIVSDKSSVDYSIGEDDVIVFTTGYDINDEIIPGSVNLYLDDIPVDTYEISDDSGNVIDVYLDSLSSNIMPGSHVLKAVFTTGDEFYPDSSVSVELNVKGIVNLDTADIIRANITDIADIPFNVTCNNDDVDDGVVEFYLDNVYVGSVNLSSSPGCFSIDTQGMSIGSHELVLKYVSDYYMNTTAAGTLEVYSPTCINVSMLSSSIRNTSFNIILCDYYGNCFDADFSLVTPHGIINTSSNHTVYLGNLSAGVNQFNVIFNGSDYYNSAERSFNMDILKLNSSILVSTLNNTVGDSRINIRIVDKDTGEIVTGGAVTVKDEFNNTLADSQPDNDDSLTLPLNLSSGNHTLSIIYNGNDYYNNSHADYNISIVKRLVSISPTVINNTLGNTTISATVNDLLTGDVITDADLIINNTINIKSDDNGTFNITLDLPAGLNDMLLTYPGNDKYESLDIHLSLNISKRNTTITGYMTDSIAGNNTININVNDTITKKAVNNADIIIYSNGKILTTTTINENQTNIQLNIPYKGKYNLTLEYTGNTNYTKSENTIPVEITGRTAAINTTVLNSTYDNTSILITLHDQDTHTPISNAEIIITTPDNSTYNPTTNENGTVIINLPVPVGINNITVTYPENSIYEKQEINSQINVTKRDSKITAHINNNIVGNTCLIIQVRDKINNTLITDGQLRIHDSNKTVTTVNMTKATTNIPLNITKDTTELLIEYTGNTNYNPSNTTLTTNIQGRNIIINYTVNNNTIDNTTITVTLLDNQTHTPIENPEVTITLPDGTNITANNTAKLDLPAGNNTINITYPGNNIYNIAVLTANITVIKIPVNITVDSQNTILGDTIQLTAHITDNNKNSINGGHIVFKINDNTIRYTNNTPIYIAVTNGTAALNYTVPVNYQSKTYKLTAVYSGTDKYDNTGSTASKLNIKKRKITMNITTNTNTTKIDQTIQITIKVKDKNNTVNGEILLKLDGKTLKDDNNKTIMIKLENNTCQYNYTIPHTVSSRTHKITALLVNNTYSRCQKDTQIQVEKTAIKTVLNTAVNNSTVTLTGLLLDEYNHTTLGTNRACIKINDKTLKNRENQTIGYNITDGKINITVRLPDTLKQGTYKITLVTGDRYTYTQLRISTTINTKTLKTLKTAKKQYVNIKPETLITQIDTDTILTQKIVNQNSKPVTTGNIEYNIDNSTIKTSIKSGESVLHYNFTHEGLYNITATYTDNTGKYYKSMTKFEVKAVDPRQDTIIKTGNTQTTINQETSIPIIIEDKYKNRITKGTVTVKLNSKQAKTIKLSTTTTYKTTFKKQGKNNLTITYTDNTGKYRTTTKTVKITVNRINTKTTTDKFNATQNRTIQITAHITTNRTVPVNEGYIIYKINNKTVKENGKTKTIKVENGIAAIKLYIPATWHNKKYTLTVIYSGTNKLGKSQQTTNFNIIQAKPILKLKDIKTRTDKTITLTATVTDKTSNAAAIFKINNKTVKNTDNNKQATIKNGTITLKYTIPHYSAKNYRLTCIYSNKKTRIETNSNLIITRQNTKIQLKKFNKSKKTLISASILDENNRPVTGTNKVTIKVNNKTVLNEIKVKNGKIRQTIDTSHAKTLTIIAGQNSWYKTSRIDVKT